MTSRPNTAFADSLLRGGSLAALAGAVAVLSLVVGFILIESRKKKSVNLLARGADIAIAAESPPVDYVERFGAAPNIYSREINYWLWQVAVDLLENRPDIGVVYVHTTDYPMHMWAPTTPNRRSTSRNSTV